MLYCFCSATCRWTYITRQILCGSTEQHPQIWSRSDETIPQVYFFRMSFQIFQHESCTVVCFYRRPDAKRTCRPAKVKCVCGCVVLVVGVMHKIIEVNLKKQQGARGRRTARCSTQLLPAKHLEEEQHVQ